MSVYKMLIEEREDCRLDHKLAWDRAFNCAPINRPDWLKQMIAKHESAAKGASDSE
jgi:hypothetical protein